MDRQRSNSPPTLRMAGDHAVIAPAASLRGKAAVKITAVDQTDRDRIERAERAVAALSRYFPSWMDDELVRLFKTADQYLEAEEAEAREDAHKNLVRSTYDMRGNAYQFGYPSAARAAELLCALLEDPCIDSVPEIILTNHLAAIRSILNHGPNQHPTALEIVLALEELVKKRKWQMMKPGNFNNA